MPHKIFIELVQAGATTVVKFTRNGWQTLSQGAGNAQPLPPHAKVKQGTQVAFIEPNGLAKAIVRVYAASRTHGNALLLAPGGSGTQRLIARIRVKDGVFLFRSAGKRATRFRESLPPRKRKNGAGQWFTTRSHGPLPNSGIQRDSRRFKVSMTNMSLGHTTTKNLVPRKGFVLVHGHHHITFSPGAVA